MASITSLSNSNYNTSSIYGNRNVLSGLASGMDTESMIENAVSGIKLKIQNLQKRRTKIEWQQEAYRSIIDKAVNFNTKYTSYSSKTNLLSASFFNNAVNTATNGTWKDKITASGKTSSDIKINAVKQLAKAATYTVSGLGGKFNGEINGVTAAEDFDLGVDKDVSTVSGSLSLKYGGTNGSTFTISFDELENLNEVKVLDADGNVKEDATGSEKLAQAIQNKLSEVTYSYTKNGFQETTTADKAIKVEVDSAGKISFSDGLGNGNKVSVDSMSENMEETLGISKGDTSIGPVSSPLTRKMPASEYLGGKKDENGNWSGGKELGITFNGTTKKINMSDIMNKIDFSDGAEDVNTQFKGALQGELDKAFGTGKITADYTDGKLSFTPSGKGDTLSLGGGALKGLGFTEDNTNYVNTGKKLSELMGEDFFKPENRIKVDEADVNLEKMVDSKGNRVAKADDGNYYRVNSDGEFLYDFKINDANISVTKDTTLESLLNSINSSAEAGVKVSYSKLTNEFKFTAAETGSNGKIEFGGMAKDLFGPRSDGGLNDNFADNFGFYLNDGEKNHITVKFDKFNIELDVDNTMTMQDFADKLNEASGRSLTASYNKETGQFTVANRSTGAEQQFSITDQYGFDYKREIEPVANFTAGQDAVMDVEINGKRFENLTRSSNSFDIDGLTVNVKGEFTTGVDKDGNPEEPITFETSTDADKIVDTIREFVNDYNEMVTEIKNAYSTMPATKNNKERYEPLTAEQEDQYSESELKAYNEKAKQGILFGDSNLSSMYSKLLSAIQPGGSDGQTLREIGIGTAYNNGMTTLSLDEDKLRAALESDPDKVKNAFTKTKEGGSSTNGLMQTMQNTLNNYVKTTGEPKGVLIQRAGSVKAYTSLNNNSLKSQMDNIDNQIDRWTDKMANQIDRYTTQFSRLEQLIAQMNSQASAMSGLMGGSSGY